MKILLPLVLLVVALAGCGGPGATSGTRSATAATPTAAAAAEPAPTAAPATPTPMAATRAELDAMARRVFPGEHPAGCGKLDMCPVTDRLRARVVQLSQTPPGQPGPVIQFCRCQNGADSMSVTSEATSSGGIAHVVLRWGSTFSSRLDLVFVRQPDAQLRLDDTLCTGGGPSSSLYAPTLVGCGS